MSVKILGTISCDRPHCEATVTGVEMKFIIEYDDGPYGRIETEVYEYPEGWRWLHYYGHVCPKHMKDFRAL